MTDGYIRFPSFDSSEMRLGYPRPFGKSVLRKARCFSQFPNPLANIHTYTLNYSYKINFTGFIARKLVL